MGEPGLGILVLLMWQSTLHYQITSKRRGDGGLTIDYMTTPRIPRAGDFSGENDGFHGSCCIMRRYRPRIRRI